MRDVFLGRVRCGGGADDALCRDCLSSERIANMTSSREEPDVGGGGGGVRALSRLSVVFLNYFLTFRTSCSPESVRSGFVGSCRTYEPCRTELLRHLNAIAPDGAVLEPLETILRRVKAVYEPDPSESCFSAETVLNEVNAASEPLRALSREMATVLILASHLYSGECIDVGESVADFLDDLFLHYGDGCERVMTQSGFSQLWNDLQMRRRGKHVDHGVQKSHSCTPEATFPSTTPSDSDPPKSDTPLVVLMPEDSGSSGAPQHSDVYVVGGEAETTTGPRVGLASSSRAARHTAPLQTTEDHEHKNLANECLPSSDLLQRFLSPGNSLVTSSEFLQLCPALVQQAVSGVCSSTLPKAPPTSTRRTTPETDVQVASQTAQGGAWLYSLASVTVITLLSLAGLFLLPLLKKSFFSHVNAFFTGLAFGTMSGDVVLHLMPQYLGLHGHEEGDAHSSDSGWTRLFPSHLQRQLAFLLTMYLLLLMECLFAAFTGEHKQEHGHSHGPVEITLRDLSASGDLENGETKPMPSRCSRIVEFLKPSNFFSGMSSKAAVIVLADTVHNFADGMAIAVGFSTSHKDGLSTSVAVFFHELPHEIGDFAVLMNCGLSYWKAFAFNLLSGLSAFLGLGVGVFTAPLFREWLLCITAGLFFFVVMGEMLPDMRLESRAKWREFCVKVFGTIFGITAMLCIAVYELSTAD